MKTETSIQPGVYSDEDLARDGIRVSRRAIETLPLPAARDDSAMAEPEAERDGAQAGPKPRSPWGRVLLSAVALLICLAVAIEVYDWMSGLFARSVYVASAAIALLAAMVASAVAIIRREVLQIHNLASVQKLRERAQARLDADTRGDGVAVIGQILRALPFDRARERHIAEFRTVMHDARTDRQALALFERTVLRPLDERAHAIVVRGARDAAVGVSISPVAALDAAITVWRSLRVIRDVASVYGFRPGPAATAVLARRLFVTAAASAAIDVAGKMWGEHLGGRVAGFLSASLAEGLVTAVRTARLGLATIEACRPLPFAEDQQPTLAQLSKRVMAGLTR